MATAAKTVYSHITKDPQVCGGRACIDGTRIRVMDLVGMLREGFSPERMREEYPSLNMAQIYAALSYFHENTAEIDAAFEEDDRILDEIERARKAATERPPR